MAFYILPHCKIWDQIIHLKNISQMLTSVQRQFLLRHICQTLPVYDQISLICTVNPTDNILLAHSPASPDMVAMVIYQKSFLHLPFYRQSKDRMEKGVHVPRETAARWYITVHWNISLRSMKL